MPQNSIRRALEQSVAILAEKKLDQVISDRTNWEEVQRLIIERLPTIFYQITDDEIESQMKIYVKTDPYNSDNGLPLPYFQTAFGLGPPLQYNESDLMNFMRDTFHDKCVEIRMEKWTPMGVEVYSAFPGMIAKEIYRRYHPYTERINPKTGLPIKKVKHAHRKHLNEFERKYCASMHRKYTALLEYDLNKCISGREKNNWKFKELQALVDSNAWKGDAKQIDFIYEQYLQLTENQKQTNFGSPDYWKVVLTEEDDVKAPAKKKKIQNK